MAKKIREEIVDLKDWMEILSEKFKFEMGDSKNTVWTLVALVLLVVAVIFGGIVISSTSGFYGPIFSKLITGSSNPGTVPANVLPSVTAVPTTPVFTATPTLNPASVPQANSSGSNTTVTLTPTITNGTVATPGAVLTKVPVSLIIAEPSNGPIPLMVTFRGSASNGPISGWEWSFGDGSDHAYTQNTSHTYTIPGPYTAQLRAQNAVGWSDWITTIILVINGSDRQSLGYTEIH